jgi:hypothetical protein
MPDDLTAWNLIADALDDALALDLEPGTRGSMLRMRAFISLLVDRPLVEVAEAAAPMADVVPLGPESD